jgi:hypothetical protein
MRKMDLWSWIKGAVRTTIWPFGKVEPAFITEQQRIDAIDALKAPRYRRLNNESVGLARFLMDEARRVCEIRIQSIRGLEGKALSLVPASGTVLAILVALGHSLPPRFKLTAIAMLAVAIFAYLKAAYVRKGSMPSIGVYLSQAVILEPWNEARIAIRQAGAWRDYGFELQAANEIKARYVRTGNFWLIAGLVTAVAGVLPPVWANYVTGHRSNLAHPPAIRSNRMFDNEKPAQAPAGSDATDSTPRTEYHQEGAPVQPKPGSESLRD